MPFDLAYLVDNGRLSGWLTAIQPGCTLVRWTDDDTYSVLDSRGKPIGYGDTKDEAIAQARCLLTDRRRGIDGVIPARVCS